MGKRNKSYKAILRARLQREIKTVSVTSRVNPHQASCAGEEVRWWWPKKKTSVEKKKSRWASAFRCFKEIAGGELDDTLNPIIGTIRVPNMGLYPFSKGY